MSDDSNLDFTIEDLNLTPMEKFCRKNLEFSSKLKIKDIYLDSVQVIDSNTIEETPDDTLSQLETITETSIDEEDEEKGYEQISIFDDMGD